AQSTGQPRRRPLGRTSRRTTLVTALGLLATYALLTVPGLAGAAASPSTTSTTSSRTADPASPARDTLDVSYGPLPEHRLDVHLPAGGEGSYPAVVFAHAGGWIAGTRSAIPDVIRTLVDDVDVAVVSIDYRLVAVGPDGRAVNSFPAASYDM